MKTKELLPRRLKEENAWSRALNNLRTEILNAEFLLEMAGDDRFVIQRKQNGWWINVR